MSTTYPCLLPTVPASRWYFNITRITGTATKVNEMNEPVIYCSVEADSVEGAERHALACLHHDYEDNLEGAQASASQAGGGYFVTVRLRPYL
jgi:hypothetical protein